MKKFKTNKLLYKYIDKNFWVDFIEDTCNLDITIYLDALYENFKKSLKYINPDVKFRDITEKQLEKIFLYQQVDYSKPITYKYFKNVVCQTHTLSNFIHLHIDLYNSIQEMQTVYQYPIDPIIKFTPQKLLSYIIQFRIDMYTGDARVNEVLELIEETENLQNNWLNKKEFSHNYWFWLWMFIELTNHCFHTLYHIKNASLEYYGKFISQLEGIEPCNIETNLDSTDESTKKKPHNAYSIQDNTNWLRAHNIYNASKPQYTILKLLTKSIIEKYSTKQILKKSQFFNFDQIELEELNNAIEFLFPMEENHSGFIKYKNYIEDNFSFLFPILFKTNDFTTFEEIHNFLTNNSKQNFCLMIIRYHCNITNDKTDKTILNTISNIEYNLKHNKQDLYLPCNQFYTNDDFNNKNIYEICQIMIVRITNQYMHYLQHPNNMELTSITNNLEILKKITNDIKKS